MDTPIGITVLTICLLGGIWLLAWLSERAQVKASERRNKAFDIAFREGFFQGWVARHYLQDLEANRPLPQELRELIPSLEDAETAIWMREYDYLTFEGYRKMQIETLNNEMKGDGKGNRGIIPGISESIR